MSQDLRGFLQTLKDQAPEEIWEIEQPVPLEYQMTALAMELESRPSPPVLFFKHVTGFEFPVVSNLFASRRRLGMMLDLHPQQLVSGWHSRAARRLPPVETQPAPVKQVIKTNQQINLFEYPIPLHFESDGGRYISGGVVIARHPDSGVGNLNFTRLQVKEQALLGASLHSRGDLWKFQQMQEARRQPLEVAVAIGVHPALSIAAATQLPIDEDEMELAGGLLGVPVEVVKAETVDLLVPAHAEMIIEGVIEAETRIDEGPFGEFTGYSTHRSTRNVLRVTAITHRQDMIFQDVVPGVASEHLNLSKTSRVPRVFQALKQTHHNAVNIHYPFSGTHFHCYVSLREPLPGQAKQVAMMLFGLDMYLKLVVVVNDDIDVYNEQEVLWALATRFQADRDLFCVSGAACSLLDPSAEQGVSTKLALDATLPVGFTAQKMTLPTEAIERARQLIHNQLS